MSTEKKEKIENGIVDTTEGNIIKESCDSIDDACAMVKKAKQDNAKEEEKRNKKFESDRKKAIDTAMAAKKEADKKAKQEEEVRKINEAKYIRKKMKRNATIMAFALCVSSAVFGYVIAGVLMYMFSKPPVWLFVGIMGIIGMIDTLLHTYLYRFIREEIYRK